jgi:hypothetical protein
MLVPAGIEVRTLTLIMGLATMALGGGMLMYFRRQLAGSGDLAGKGNDAHSGKRDN